MNDGGLFSAHLQKFNTLVSELTSISYDIKDDEKIIVLLCSLPDSWTIYAKYIILTHTSIEAMWLRKLYSDLGLKKVICIECDSQSAIHLTKNLTCHTRSKYIDI